MTKRIGLIVNPTSGKGRGAAIGAEVAARLAADGHEVIDLSDQTGATARDRALAGVASGLDVLAVTGGDGMVNLGVKRVPPAPTRFWASSPPGPGTTSHTP